MIPATHDYRAVLAARSKLIAPRNVIAGTSKQPADLVLVGSGARARVQIVEKK